MNHRRWSRWWRCGVRSRASLSVLTLAAAGLVVGWGGAGVAQEDAQDDARQRIEQGRYLVHHVAHCTACHTPRDATGNLRQDRLLQGATIPIASPYRSKEWAFEAPWLAGLPSYDEQAVVYLLQHGKRPNGYTPRSPMPSFRMTEADAKAVVAYLASL